MAAYTVVRDSYRWMDADGVLHEAERGKTIDVSDEEGARGVQLGYLEEGGSSGSLPKTHKDLDALAAERGVTFPDDVKTVAEKQAFLGGDGAQFSPAGGPSFQGAPGAAAAEELEELSDEELVEHASKAGVVSAANLTRPELVAAIQAAGAITTGPNTPSP